MFVFKSLLIFAKNTPCRLKTVVSLLLAFAVLVAPLGKLWILFAFQMNQPYIAQNLCEQREVEDNSCQGACHLKQKLAEEEAKEKNASQHVKYEMEVWTFASLVSLACPLPAHFYEEQTLVAYYPQSKLADFEGEIQHPPSVGIL